MGPECTRSRSRFFGLFVDEATQYWLS